MVTTKKKVYTNKINYRCEFVTLLEVERTVRCSRTVRFLVMFGRFEVRFLAKITCSDMFEVRFWWFWKILGPFFINKVRKQFGFWWCLRGSKFSFGPKWDVWMCLMFDLLKFGMFKVRFLLFDPPLIVLSFYQSITNLSSYQHIMYLHYN